MQASIQHLAISHSSNGRSQLKDFRKLNVWEMSHHLTPAVYKATLTLPRGDMNRSRGVDDRDKAGVLVVHQKADN